MPLNNAHFFYWTVGQHSLEDGFYYWYLPDYTKSDGYFSDWVIKDIYTKLEELNKDWNDIINKEFENK